MNHKDALLEIQQTLIANGSDYLKNILHQTGITCETCATPVNGTQYCNKCETYAARTDTADLVGSMIYELDGQQSGRLMYGYKTVRPGPSHEQTVTMLVALGIRAHKRCAERLVDMPTTRWATVPSLRRFQPLHPLRKLLSTFLLEDQQIDVAAGQKIRYPHAITPANFTLLTPVPPDSHVIVFDDTWMLGGHAQSVAAALKHAGAAKVSILTVARWIDLAADLTTPMHRELILSRDYDPELCPWTGGVCP